MEADSGEIVQSTANSSNAIVVGPVTVANDVLFAGSSHPTGTIYAMHAKTGEILWSYATNASVYGGMLVSDGCVYLGNLYNTKR